MVALGYFTFENNRAYATTNKMVAHTDEVIHHIEQLNSGIINMQSSVRGYALTHDSLFLQSFINSKKIIPTHISEIRKLVSDNAVQLSNMDSMEPLIRRKAEDFTNITSYIAQSTNRVVPVNTWYENKISMDNIRSILQTMKEHELKLRKVRIDASEKKQQEFSLTIVSIFTFIAVVLTSVYLIVYYNLQKRNKIEEKLKKDWSMFQAILDNASSVISIKNIEGKYILINNKFLSYIKKTAEETLNKRVSDLIAKDYADLQTQMDHHVMNSKETLQTEISLSILNEPKTFIATKFPLVDNKGKVYAICSISTDISERKLIEDKIEKLNQDLNQNLEHLEIANRELESFTYSVSHDLRAPLRSIDGYTRILQDDYADKLDEEGFRLINIVLQNASRMTVLIDDLLNFSRIGKLDICKSEINMHSIVDQLLTEFHPDITFIKVNLSNTLKTIADNNLIRQVWINLISNAIKYSAKNQHPEIFIGWKFEQDKKIFYIRDNGVGFDMKYAHKLYGVFQRLHSVEEFEGTGVGLAIAQRIIQKHGGEIWAEASLGNGATFYFHLGD
jgi:signal transduction histidine kinase